MLLADGRSGTLSLYRCRAREGFFFFFLHCIALHARSKKENQQQLSKQLCVPEQGEARRRCLVEITATHHLEADAAAARLQREPSAAEI